MSGSTEWRTPPEVFAQYHREFSFNVDAAATPENALLKGFGDCYCDEGDWHDETGDGEGNYFVGRYHTATDDGTKREHYQPGDRVWCNPPYSPAAVLAKFIETAAISAREQGVLWCFLLNSTTLDTRYFHKFVWDCKLHRPRERVELRLLPGRMRFLRPDGTSAGSPPHGNMIVVFHPWEPGS